MTRPRPERHVHPLGAMLLALTAGFAAASAQAAELKVFVSNASGAPLANAVVLVQRPGAAPPRPGAFAWPQVMEQRDLQFKPFVLIVPVGSDVSFPNRDTVRHHVYSFSPAKTFELRLYGKDETRRVRLDRTGVVALGCNIHDDMTAFIRVVDTPWAGRTDSGGEVTITDLPQGSASLVVWHPYIRGGRDLVRAVTVGPNGAATRIALDVRPAPLPHGGY